MALNFLLDDREHSQTLKDAFQYVSAMRIFDYETAHLEIGDVQCGNVCIERKEASDFIGSICDGRLKEQARKMQLGFEHRYIIIEGNPFQTGSGISDNAIIGTMTSALVKHNIKILVVENELQFVETCYSLVKKHIDNYQFDPNFIPSKIPKKTTDEILAMMIMQFPNISYSKAKNISSLYNNSMIEFVNNVTPAKLMTLEGIGKKISNDIYNFIKK